jgi:DNA-binding transcriptional MerR regulator
VADDAARPLISIGEFARRTRLTVKALRIYDRVGLLRPAGIDEASRYRRYDAGQVRTGQLIGLLRGADLSLADIGLILQDLAVTPTASYSSATSKPPCKKETIQCSRSRLVTSPPGA